MEDNITAIPESQVPPHNPVSDTNQIDIRYMTLALQEANKALQEGEIPVGCIIVSDGHIVGKGHNLTQTLQDVTAHAEMQAITAAADFLGGKYLDVCTLYVTLEPCDMCAGAIALSQISRIVFGVSDPKRGFSRHPDAHIIHQKVIIEKNVLSDECSTLLKDFFAKKR